MKNTGPRLTPRAWWLLSAVFVLCSVASYTLLIVVALTGIKRKDCPCEEPEDKYDVEFGKECCIHFTEYDFCTANQCLCATPENIATYDHVTGSVYTQFSASGIHCKDKEKVLTDKAIIWVSILGVAGTGFLIAAAAIICPCAVKKKEKPTKASLAKVVGVVKDEAVHPPAEEAEAPPGVASVAHAQVKVVKAVDYPTTADNQPTDTAKI